MKNELPDDKFDQMMQKLMSDASLDGSAIDDIADSPTLWWDVQRRINEQKAAKSPWPPVNGWKRWLLIAVPTAAAIFIATFVLVNRAPTEPQNLAVNNTAQPAPENIASDEPVGPSNIQQPATVLAAEKEAEKPRPLKTVAHSRPSQLRPTNTTAATRRAEIKTDFIALTYARDPDSGQLVRVRVPSSMMVTLGLVANVKKPTEMVDAEVLVGDDGLTRAIRFIR